MSAVVMCFEFGSPAINMPARPHLVPGVEKAKDEIGDRLKAAALAALDGNSAAAEIHLTEAGTAGVNAVQQVIRSGTLQPIQPQSYLQRTTGRAARRQRARHQAMSLRELAESEAASATPLIDTAAYSRSITSVVRDKK